MTKEYRDEMYYSGMTKRYFKRPDTESIIEIRKLDGLYRFKLLEVRGISISRERESVELLISDTFGPCFKDVGPITSTLEIDFYDGSSLRLVGPNEEDAYNAIELFKAQFSWE